MACVGNVRKDQATHLFTACTLTTVQAFQLRQQIITVLSSRIMLNPVLVLILNQILYMPVTAIITPTRARVGVIIAVIYKNARNATH
jgi:hypothetical protein